MTLGRRIDELLAAKGLSQAELARRVGMQQSSMNALVNDKSRSTRFIVSIARELQTTPAYLAGETDDPNADFPDETLTASERRWVEQLRSLTDADRRLACSLVERLAGSGS